MSGASPRADVLFLDRRIRKPSFRATASAASAASLS
jgi:hypothetical protein